MFRTLERLLRDPNLNSPPPPPAPTYNPGVFKIHPYQLSQWLEQVWGFAYAASATFAGHSDTPFLGDPKIVPALALPTGPQLNPFDAGLASGIPQGKTLPGVWQPGFDEPFAPAENPQLALPWEHLMYAYVLESTGMVEIFAEIVRRFAVGETLETPSVPTQTWLRSTEELFFRDPPLFHLTGLTSLLRPDAQVARRNAYWRLLGMDLPHAVRARPGSPHHTGQPWKQDVGIANLRFHELWLDLLRSIWTGYENAMNTSGPNPTDPGYIYELCWYIQDMLQMRRQGGNLARDEFVHISTMSWFHLTVERDTPIVVDLRAMGTDPADRLAKLGERVGIRPSPRARELFEIADLVSAFVRFLELGYFKPANVNTMYALNSTLRTDVLRIIDLWEMATGDSIKADAVRLSGQQRPRDQHAPPPRSLSVPSGPTGPTRAPAHHNGSGAPVGSGR
ncbi:MAG TPA: hypothetical protein VMA77_32625 [Solirubrobacteraceae bacterium]|nr:hypothetical protein [Solirubrobacteraceae bacterium]